MRRAGPAIAAVCGIVAVGVVIAAWLQPRPSLTEADARVVARSLAVAVGAPAVAGTERVVATPFRPRDGGAARPAWAVTLRLAGGPVDLWLDRGDGAPLLVDDTSPTGALLTDRQVTALTTTHRPDPAVDRRLRRNEAATLAGILAASLAAWLGLAVLPRR